MRSVLAAALALLAAACHPPAPVSAPAEAGGTGMGESPGPLVASFQIRPTADSVDFTLSVTNSGAQPLALEFRSGQTYDFAVSEGGREVWRWSAERMFTQALRTETLAPGQTLTWRELWRPAASLRGRTLTATARLVSANHRVERAQTFRLP